MLIFNSQLLGHTDCTLAVAYAYTNVVLNKEEDAIIILTQEDIDIIKKSHSENCKDDSNVKNIVFNILTHHMIQGYDSISRDICKDYEI